MQGGEGQGRDQQGHKLQLITKNYRCSFALLCSCSYQYINMCLKINCIRRPLSLYFLKLQGTCHYVMTLQVFYKSLCSWDEINFKKSFSYSDWLKQSHVNYTFGIYMTVVSLWWLYHEKSTQCAVSIVTENSIRRIVDKMPALPWYLTCRFTFI